MYWLWYWIRFAFTISLPDSSLGKKVIIFRVDISSSVHIDNKKKGLDDSTLTIEAQYSFNFSRSNRKFCLSLHYNGSNSFLFVNATKIYQFKAKDSEIKKYLLHLGNIAKDFTANNMKKAGLNGYAYDISVGYNMVNTSNTINIHKYLMKKHDIK